MPAGRLKLVREYHNIFVSMFVIRCSLGGRSKRYWSFHVKSQTLPLWFTFQLQVILALHHPPGNADVITKYSQMYQTVVALYADIIVLQVCGHTHHDHFKMVSDEHVRPQTTLGTPPCCLQQKYMYILSI